MFWRYLDPTHPALKTGQAEMGPEVIADLYRRMDELVGKVREKLDPKSALIVMSDHGFKSFRRGVNLNSWLYRNGYLSLLPGKTASEEWFKGVDWESTKAYALGLGGLYLNLKGREERGIVSAGEEAKAIKTELIRKLTGLRDDLTGEIAITEAYDRDKLYNGPYKENAPDLIIGYNQGYRASWDSVTGIVNDTVFENNKKAWSGDHCIDPRHVPGVFFSSQKINTKTPSILDIAPTILSLFGLPIPAHMDGRLLVGVSASGGPEKGRKQ
jgi:predicted AlkP superfamily phosphohydrolase/phosphomutase